MTIRRNLPASALHDYGLWSGKAEGIFNLVEFERPAYLFDARRLKNVRMGAFSYINGQYTSSVYDTRIGRYCSIAEGAVIGPYEHPTDGLTQHLFAYSGPEQFPAFFDFPDYERLAPERTVPFALNDADTVVGHDVWIGAGSFIRRGLRIGNGAVIAAGAVVTRDVPPYAIVVGTPARVLRLRFDETVIERLLRLQWWRYDLAPHKQQIDFSRMPAALDALEALQAEGQLAVLQPPSYRVTRRRGCRFDVEPLPTDLYSSSLPD